MTTRTRVWRLPSAEPPLPKPVLRCRRRFLKFFPQGFQDETYLERERNFKWEAHEGWEERLSDEVYLARLERGEFAQITAEAVRIESKTNLLFSFERMALRDAVRTPESAQAFAEGLYDWLYGASEDQARFEQWCRLLAELPRRQTRVLTWPLLTVFGFLARPYAHQFLKPNVTRRAALEYGYDFSYHTQPDWQTYDSLLAFSRRVKRDLKDMRPRDMIDIQSFIRVQGSDEYE